MLILSQSEWHGSICREFSTSIWRYRHLCKRTKLRVFMALYCQFYSMVVKPGCCPVPWSLIFMPFIITSPYTMGYNWQDQVYIQRLYREAGTGPVIQSGTANSGYMGGWLTSLRTVLPTRMPLFRTTLDGGSLWDCQASCGLGRLIRPVLRI